jgi:hypothetical protein
VPAINKTDEPQIAPNNAQRRNVDVPASARCKGERLPEAAEAAVGVAFLDCMESPYSEMDRQSSPALISEVALAVHLTRDDVRSLSAWSAV